MTTALPQDRDYLQQEFKKADDMVIQVLMSDADRFSSSAQMRDALNHARATRDWAGSQLANLKRAEHPETGR